MPDRKSRSSAARASEAARESDALRGGCLCGDVRFEIDEVYDAGYCHCSICRRSSGAPAVAWANLPSRAFRLVAGETRAFASSENWVRHFCPRCGAPVFQQVPDPPDDGSDPLCILIGSLDDPNAIRPTAHIWCSARLPSFEFDDDLPCFEEGELTAPEKRGPARSR